MQSFRCALHALPEPFSSHPPREQKEASLDEALQRVQQEGADRKLPWALAGLRDGLVSAGRAVPFQVPTTRAKEQPQVGQQHYGSTFSSGAESCTVRTGCETPLQNLGRARGAVQAPSWGHKLNKVYC